MLEPLHTWFDTASGAPAAIGPDLERLYDGALAFPEPPPDRPHVIANFVTGVDGVISYGKEAAGQPRPLFGDPHDRFLMALLRLTSDAVMLGAKTLAAGLPGGTLRWDAALPAPERDALQPLFQAAAARMQKPERVLHVLVTRSGELPGAAELLSRSGVELLVATTPAGRHRAESDLARATSAVRCIQLPQRGEGIDLVPLLAALREGGVRLLLSEGGARLHGSLESAGLVDELFLTTAPWVPGSDTRRQPRLTFSGIAHPPDATPRLALVSLKRHGDQLFTRRRYEGR